MTSVGGRRRGLKGLSILSAKIYSDALGISGKVAAKVLRSVIGVVRRRPYIL